MRCGALGALVLSVAAAQAGDGVREAADRVVAAVRDDAQLTLHRLAARDHPDPWLVAEDLCFRGKLDAAAAFAAAGAQEELAVYVAGRHGQKPDEGARRALDAAHVLYMSNHTQEAWRILKQVGPPGDPVLEVRLYAARARVLRDLGRDPADDCLRAGKLAHDLGWRRGATAALRHLAYRACFDECGDKSVGAARLRLGEGEATVAYGTHGYEMLAAVITATSTWYVPLCKREEIEAACRAFAPPSPGAPVVTDYLERRLVRPLALGAGISKLYVLAREPFRDLPWALLVGDREVALGLEVSDVTALHPWKAEPGRDVLALGAARRAGDERAEQEARAVGTVVLTGELTGAALEEALASRPHWRALHVALPAQLVERLLGREVVWDNERQRKEPRVDLLVWSGPACPQGPWREAAWARRYTGPPRVLRSLWEVDGEATLALMTRFYELWNAETPLPACTALKRAQDHVRADPRWTHPYYWAGWQLWAAMDPEDPRKRGG